MFYLRSRGIDKQAAQKMIIYAFAAELTEALPMAHLNSRC
jgi:Fe-S cluster assembly protein SufD